ncbi:MAG: Smr/MutS family protein [Gammaproteobacteria bacterium]|nr:Smr/MutS family protein [Gammaproteobacteria bacterium]MCW5582984.1 Smr/MutS family protein [Gammaproteobacteria bacterium]
MRKKITIDKEDLNAFYKAVRDIKPLKVNKIHLKSPIPEQVAAPAIRRSAAMKESLHLNESLNPDPVESEAFIIFKQSGVSDKMLRKLRKGQYNVGATLDLHGMSVDEAKAAVSDFLQQCVYEEIRVALIIHGKGHYRQMPILKNKLNHWLRNVNIVLAFCSAAPQHGSRGAIYILLKRNLGEA